MKFIASLLVGGTLLVALVSFSLVMGRPTMASSEPYEVWIIDQADAAKGGAKLYIYRGEQLEGDRCTGTPQVVGLEATAAGVGHGPGVRPHLLAFNSTHTHALIANVASGHVYFMRTADRKIVASTDVGEQAHAAYAAPDDNIVMVANQNGKKLARIHTNFANESLNYDPADDLNLGALEGPDFPDNAPICPILFTAGGKKAYVTLRGGGLYVVDVAATPMRVVRSYTKDQIAPAGCGGALVGNKVYINSGTIASSDLYVFDGNTDSLMKHIPFSPLGKDGHGLMVVGKYLWMGNRASGNIVVVDTETDTNVSIIREVGAAPDIMDMSPSGNHIFVALRGPNNLTGGPAAKGQTPGFAAFRPDAGGYTGTRTLFVAIGDQSADSPRDPHSLAVRRGVSEVAAPAALPRVGEQLRGGTAVLGVLVGLGFLGVGMWLRQRMPFNR